MWTSIAFPRPVALWCVAGGGPGPEVRPIRPCSVIRTQRSAGIRSIFRVSVERPEVGLFPIL